MAKRTKPTLDPSGKPAQFVGVTMPADELAELKAFARETERSVSGVVRLALRRLIPAERAAERELRQRLGLED